VEPNATLYTTARESFVDLPLHESTPEKDKPRESAAEKRKSFADFFRMYKK
jgi:hypothetical protein